MDSLIHIITTIVTLVFLPAMYAIWFRIRPAEQRVQSPAENV